MAARGSGPKTLQLLTCFELHSRKLHEEELLLSLLAVLQLHQLLVLLLFQETLPDLLHLLAVPLLLAHLLQNGQGLGQLGAAVPRVAVLGRAAHHVQALQHVHDVVDAPALHTCTDKKREKTLKQLQEQRSTTQVTGVKESLS